MLRDVGRKAPKVHYLVTGGLGFIGGHVVEALLSRGDSISVVDSLSEIVYASQGRVALSEKFEAAGISVSKCDINDLDRLPLPNPLPDELRVINCAALPGQRYSWDNTREYFRANTLSAVSLARLLPPSLPTKVVHISTSSIYGETAVADEEAPANPISPYGHSKYAAEVLLEDLLSRKEMCSLTILRLFSIYGPRQRDDMAISRLIKAIDSNSVFTIFGSGSQSRTPTYVGDVVNAILLSLSNDADTKRSNVFNVGGRESLTLQNYIQIIESLLGRTGKYEYVEAEKGDQIETRSDTSFIELTLGWTPNTSFQEGIQAQLSWEFERAEQKISSNE